MRTRAPNPKMYKTWQEWAMKLNGTLSEPEPFEMEPFAKATLPSAAEPYRLIYVTDEAGGAVPAFNDGTNWRRVTDRAVVS